MKKLNKMHKKKSKDCLETYAMSAMSKRSDSEKQRNQRVIRKDTLA